MCASLLQLRTTNDSFMMAPARCALALALVAAAQALAAPRSRRGALRMSIAPSDVVVMICA